MKIKEVTLKHFVKGEDLNHHNTLYAGRGIEWMVESGLLASCEAVGSNQIVCMRINSLLFRKPVPKGELVNYAASIVFTGRTSLTAYVKVENSITGEFIVDGFFTYVYVDGNGKAAPHGITIEPEGDYEQALYNQAEGIMLDAKAHSKDH
ncbi:MAG: acyl-CoA thioesterase [Clostridiales Family XIII bacterium]|jgi:acyl-CoA hydrolase|nr:acyl-CoA thioesterase [Clostridiales Family XIII bacterium]